MTVLAAWIVYALVVSGLFALGAWWAEQSLRSVGWSGRWVWVIGMVLSVLVPLWAWLRPVVYASVEAVPAAGFIPLAPIVVGESVLEAGGVSLDVFVALGWAVLTAMVVFRLTVAYLRLQGMRRSWRRTEIWGETVYVTRDLGPAVFGLRRSAILMPAWALELESRIQHLMLMHEREHVRAGDVRLAALGQLLVLAQPWNLPLVWQWRRLREAVEVDCDCRVLRLDPDARAYGALLLEVGRRRALPQLALAFAEPRTFLERRIDLLTRARHGGRHAAGLAGLALLAAGVAVCTRDPLAVRPPLAIATVMTAQAPDRWQEQPVFTPFTTPPRLRNADEISRELERTYPRLLRDAGIGGQAMMWFFIDEMGRTRTTRLQESTGYPALDEAASRVAAAMQFTPALNRAKPVSVWVQIPIRFSTEQRDQTDGTRARSSTRVMTVSAPSLPDERSERAAIQTLEQEAARGADVQAERDGPAIEARLRELTARLQRTAPRISWGTVSDLTVDVEPLVRENATRMRVAAAQRNAELPRFTPFTEPPRLLNRPEIGRALEQNYPPLLRDAGIGGQVMLWFNIDERGRVARAVLQRSSNYPALDDAAIRVAESMRFTPAKNRQDPVSVWVQIPIRFATK